MNEQLTRLRQQAREATPMIMWEELRDTKTSNLLLASVLLALTSAGVVLTLWLGGDLRIALGVFAPVLVWTLALVGVLVIHHKRRPA